MMHTLGAFRKINESIHISSYVHHMYWFAEKRINCLVAKGLEENFLFLSAVQAIEKTHKEEDNESFRFQGY